MSTEVSIKDVKAIRELSFDLPDGEGGVLVLKGANAQGKTTAIECLQALLSGSGRLEARDHAARGRVEGFGASISVSTATRRSGEITVDSLVGKFDIGALVDPGVKDAEKADNARIKALLSISGAKADPSLFYNLVGGKEHFESLVDAKALETSDLVTLAASVHRAFHAGARSKESAAEHERTHEKAAREYASGVNLEADDDEAQLQERYAASVREEERLKGMRNHYLTNKNRLAVLKDQLTAAEAQHAGTNVADARQAVAAANAEVEAHVKILDDLAAQYLAAEQKVKELKNHRDHQAQLLREAEQHDKTVQQIRQSIEELSTTVADPGEEAIAAATKQVADAQQAMLNGAKIRSAKEHLTKASLHAQNAKQLSEQAELLRNAAKRVDDVLADSLPPGPLRVDGGRLVCDSPRGEGVPYGEESDGYRYTIAIGYGVQLLSRLPRRAPLPLSQDAWQHLDYTHRQLLLSEAQKHKVWIITAEASSGKDDDPELHVERYGNG